MPLTIIGEFLESPSHIEITCPIERAMLGIIRALISMIAEAMGFPSEDIYKIEMAVDEACANVIMHAYGPRRRPHSPAEELIHLKLSLSPESLTICIGDQGKRCPPGQWKGADSIEAYQTQSRERSRGLGILIMKEFMDEVRLTVEPEVGTQVELRKFLIRQRTNI